MKMSHCWKSHALAHLFKFYRCYGNKNGGQNRLLTEKLPFWTKFKVFELYISKAKYQKILLICLLLQYLFWYLLVLYVNFSVKPLNFAQILSISCFLPILAAIFVTIATVKVKVI